MTAKAGMSGVVRSAVALMFSTVGSAALGMVFWAVAARMYDTTTLGRTSAAASAITLLGGLAQLSLTTVFVRFVPTLGIATGRFVRRGYAAAATAGLVLSVGFLLLGLARSFLGQGPLPFLGFCTAVICATFSTLQDGVLTALRRAAWIPVENIGIALGKLSLLPVMLAVGATAPMLLAWALPTVAAVAVVSGVVFGRLIPATHAANRSRSRMPGRRELAGFMTAEYLDGILGTLMGLAPPVLVTLVLGPAQNAIFYLPWLIGTAIFGLLWNIVISFVVEATTDPLHTRRHLRHALRLGLPVTVGGGAILLAGAPAILAVAGHNYSAGGASALRLIAVALPLEAVCTFFCAISLLEKKAWSIFWLRLSQSALFLTAAVPAMHRFGASGAAAAFLCAEVIVASCATPQTIRQYRKMSNRTIDDDATQVMDLREILPAAPAPTVAARAGSIRGVAAVPRIGPLSNVER
jgi:O-antigen/teichoic acid export membrane protein